MNDKPLPCSICNTERAMWEAEIDLWLGAYPEGVFIPPTDEQYSDAHEALRAIGMTLDKFSADMARHVLRSLPKRVEIRRRIERGDNNE